MRTSLIGGLKTEAYGVDAVSDAAGRRTIWKHMTQVSVAARTSNLYTNHAVTVIGTLDQIGALQWFEETGPATAGFELGV